MLALKNLATSVIDFCHLYKLRTRYFLLIAFDYCWHISYLYVQSHLCTPIEGSGMAQM